MTENSAPARTLIDLAALTDLRDDADSLRKDLATVLHDLFTELDRHIPIHERWRWEDRLGNVLDAAYWLAVEAYALADDAAGGAA